MSLCKTFLPPGATIGIIGGGQLGKMMTLAAKEAGFRVVILEPTADSPAGQVADEEIVAPYDDREALAQLSEKSDVITYEFENIDYEGLRWLTEQAYVPQGAELIRIIQDRINEKQALRDAGVQVAPYVVVRNEEDLHHGIETIGYPSVLKTSRGGYDGKGQVVIREKEDVEDAKKLLQHSACVLEAWIPFDRELSIIITRGTNGDLEYSPIAENKHINNILHTTIVPAHISPSVEKTIHTMAEKIAEHLQLVGTLAIELFLTKQDEVYVNELAPRPHNSGHYSIEACEISQFAQHIRAICGWPLRKPKLLKPAIMVNVLGQHMDSVIKAIPQHPEWSVHFYGKAKVKENRKMGHITILTDNLEETLQNLKTTGIWFENN